MQTRRNRLPYDRGRARGEMLRCSQKALEQALLQLAEHAGDNKHRSNWMSTFLAACWVHAADYPRTINGVNQAVDDLFVLLPDNREHGRINPFVRSSASGRWLKITDSGRSTVWNTGTRQGTQRVLFNQEHFKHGLRPDAIDVLLEGIGDDAPLPRRDALALFLTREHLWDAEPTREQLHEEASQKLGLSTHEFARITADGKLGCPVLGDPEWSPELIEHSALRPPAPSHLKEEPLQEDKTLRPVEHEEPPEQQKDEGLTWTQDVCHYPLRDVDVDALTHQVLESLANAHMALPDAERLVRRSVNALLVGNLILQGPPGTGKTTLARLLADAFEVQLIETTATSEWSPYHVVGGFRPAADGGLSANHGAVTRAALQCAQVVRQDEGEKAEAEAGDESLSGYQAAWLFIDEFNRADIDKAIGSLFTVLSSCDARHLQATPVDLWFESTPDRRNLWIPARFRIIGTMNDLDTSFVNQMSQGLTRRFQFVTVGVPTERASTDQPITEELRQALASAHRWLQDTYSHDLPAGSLEEASQTCEEELKRLQSVVDGLRHPDTGPGWPVGTAQIVDVLRLMLLQRASNPDIDLAAVVDDAVADRLVPQMAGVGNEWQAFAGLFEAQGFAVAAHALRHLADPHHMP
ncbi:AAA family ATPase [Streptomyces sp. NPDC047017]|uniref:AAA family ATPase n=1 Tax=Streptomyces sp. NPDC047017 TaxID=3155024 RepID=UPI0033C97C46